MQKSSFPRHPLCPIPEGPTPCPRGDPPNPICQLEQEGKCLCRPPQCVTCKDAAG